jgi:hypothetical protein
MMIQGADGLFAAGNVLPDLFTTSTIFNAGDYRCLGHMASISQNLGDNLQVNFMYGSGDAVIQGRTELASQSPDDLRSMIHRGRRHAVTSQVSGSIPITGAQFNVSYRWTDQNSVTPSHFLVTQRTLAEAGLIIIMRQPIRTFSAPFRLEAWRTFATCWPKATFPSPWPTAARFSSCTRRSVSAAASASSSNRL